MFDVTNFKGGNTNIKFSSVSGIMAKSCPESKFARFHQNSRMAESFFDKNRPHRATGIGYQTRGVTILQVMLCADNNFLVEFIDTMENSQ